jgi:tetratricopeptide (TPR) repeat protein
MPVAQPASAVAVPAEPPPAPPPTRRRRFALRGAGLAFLLVGSLLLASQVWVRSEAAAMQHDLATQTSPDLDDLWDRYRSLAPFGLLPGSGLRDVREELRTAMLKSADRVLNSYRGDDPTTTQKGWQKAHDRLRAAVDLNYRDRPTRAKLMYTQAHIDRIDAQAMRGRGQKDPARQKLRDAVEEFQDAAKLAPDWPDPYLGLARVYSYEQPDLKQLEAALNELEKRNYPMGRREKAMLADGFRRKGIELQGRAAKSAEADDRLELLERSRDTFHQALGFYDEIPGYANARANRADVEERLAQIEAALEHLDEPGVLEKLLGF